MECFTTVCPRNCYSTCSFKVWVSDNKLVKIEPEPLNRATPEGPCIKGLSYIERAHSSNRISTPLIKTNDGFKPISWDDAVQIIANKLASIKESYGSHAVFTYSASGSSGLLNASFHEFWELYGGTSTVYGNLCWPAGLEATRLTLGENKHNVAWDLANAKLIILWGKNPAETNIHQMVFIEQAQQKGAKLVVIDPRRTPSSERADLFIQPKPGSDGLLALHLAKLLIDADAVDTDFIHKHVFGFSEFKESLSALNAEDISKECGVKIEHLKMLAAWMGEIKPMTIVPGYGMQRYANGGQTIRCILALNAITGNIGIPGGGWHYADLQSDVFSTIKEPESYFPNKEKDGVFRRAIPTAKLGEGMLALSDPILKMAWVERGNPLSQNPDSTSVKKAFSKMEFVVVVDQFMTDTAQMADIVLPAKNMFEQADIVTSYWNPYLLYKPKIIQANSSIKTETEIYKLLAKALGLNFHSPEGTLNLNSDQDEELWLKKNLEKAADLKLEDLKKQPQIPPKLQDIAFSDYKFNTPSGKIELLSITANQSWGVNALPDYTPLNPLDKNRYPFQLLSPNTKYRIHSQFGNLKSIAFFEGKPAAVVNYSDASNLGIKNGDLIEIYNHKGNISIQAKLDASIRPGIVVLYNGYWNSEGACPNLFIDGKETDMGHGTAFHDTWVNYKLIKNSAL